MPAAGASRPLEWSARSLADLLAIDDYYVQFGHEAAANVLGAIVSPAQFLERFPFTGRPGKRRGTRHRVVAKYPYIVVYRVKPRTVQIVRVLHQSRKYFS